MKDTVHFIPELDKGIKEETSEAMKIEETSLMRSRRKPKI